MLNGENGNGIVMPVSPMGAYGNNGSIGDWWILFFIAMMWGGFGGNWGMGNYGAGLGIDFPWLMNGQNNVNANTNAGFNQAATQSALGDIQLALADLNQTICQSCNGIQSSVMQQMYTGQLNDLQRSFDAQMANFQGFNGVQTSLNNLNATVLSENCSDRFEAQKNTQDIITAITAGIQSLKDDACARELAAERRENENLRSQLNFAQLTGWMSQNCSSCSPCGSCGNM